jgi:hypothetical protein
MEDGTSQSAYVHDFLMIYAVCLKLSELWFSLPVSTACPPIRSLFISPHSTDFDVQL